MYQNQIECKHKSLTRYFTTQLDNNIKIITNTKFKKIIKG